MTTQQGWVKLHRQILEWEWFEDPNTFRLFMYLLLKANHKDRKFKGQMVYQGQLLTGRDLLAKDTGLSVQKVRTALNNLKSTNEITIESSSKGTIIQIVNYKKYQEQPTKQPTSNQQVTTNKNVKNVKEDRRHLFSKWLEYRRSIKHPIDNDLTLEKLEKRFNSESLHCLEFTINNSIENNWRGLFWDKYEENNRKGQPLKKGSYEYNVELGAGLIDVNGYKL